MWRSPDRGASFSTELLREILLSNLRFLVRLTRKSSRFLKKLGGESLGLNGLLSEQGSFIDGF